MLSEITCSYWESLPGSSSCSIYFRYMDKHKEAKKLINETIDMADEYNTRLDEINASSRKFERKMWIIGICLVIITAAAFILAHYLGITQA